MIFLIGAAALAGALPQSGVGFRGYQLGITISEAKALPIAKNQYGPISLSCSSDADAYPGVEVPRAESVAGVVRCHPVQIIGSSKSFADYAPSPEVKLFVDLYFYHGRLFRVDLVAEHSDASGIIDGLISKYGPPATKIGESQVRSGASFDQITSSWRSSAFSIVAVDPDLTTEKMTVTYSDTRAETEVEARTRAASRLEL